jgi:hypothetical protein
VKENLQQYREEIEKESWDDGWEKLAGWDKVKKYFRDKLGNGDGDDTNLAKKGQNKQEDKDIALPLPVARASEAPFKLY